MFVNFTVVPLSITVVFSLSTDYFTEVEIITHSLSTYFCGIIETVENPIYPHSLAANWSSLWKTRGFARLLVMKGQVEVRLF